MNLAPEWLKGLWHKHPLVVIAVFAVVAAAVISALVWPVTDLVAAHDVGLVTGAQRAMRLQTARASVRTQLLTLGAGVFAFGALVYTARNYTLARSTFKATETRVLNERFAAAASQLGDVKPAVRLAGVYAMAGLADDWPQHRQTCVDVLCAYLRMPYAPDPGNDAPAAEQQAFRAGREVRHAVIRVITAHLRADDRRAATVQDWRGLDLDFTGAVFDGGQFHGAQFTGGRVSFGLAQFTGGEVSFGYAQFTGGQVDFAGAQFTGGEVSFGFAQFTGGGVDFDSAQFTGGEVSFGLAHFTGGEVSFASAQFTGGEVSFGFAQFTGGEVNFTWAQFTGGEVSFASAQFTGGEVSFGLAHFTGGTVSFDDARFTGGAVDFGGADWSVPPRLPTWDHLPAGVTLPASHTGPTDTSGA